MVQSCEWTDRNSHGDAYIVQSYEARPKLPPPSLTARPAATSTRGRAIRSALRLRTAPPIPFLPLS
eukprot:9359934-Lingulodinium_polyedra.AAC.1